MATTARSVSSDAPETQSTDVNGPRVIDAREEDASAYETRAPEGATLYEQLAAPFDVHFQDTRGGVPITYITGEQVASRLNLVLGLAGWQFLIVSDGYDADADEFWAHGDLRAFVGGEWVSRQQYGSSKVKRSKPPCGFLANSEDGIACGAPARDHGNGKDKINHRYLELGRGMPLDIGFDKKGAATDCLKKCATLLGVGLYLMARKGGVPNETAQRRPAERRAPAQSPARQAERPARPANDPVPLQIRCKQPICTAKVEGDARCGDVRLVHPKDADHPLEQGACGVAIEPTEIDGKTVDALAFVNEYSLKRFKQPYCRRHYDAHVRVEERHT